MGRVDVFRVCYSAEDAGKLLWILLGIEWVLICAYVLTHIVAPNATLGPLRNFLDVDREVSIPTWFSAMQLFAVGVVLLLQVPKSGQLGRFLFILALGFIFLSMDEAAALHDAIYRSAQRTKLPWIEGAEYLLWMVLYVVAAAIALMIGRRPALFAWSQHRGEVLWVVSGAAIFVGGGIGVEILTHYLFHIAVDARFYLAVAAEEFLEMAGVSVMLYGFMLLGIRLERENDNGRVTE